jgi:hypothetical protein
VGVLSGALLETLRSVVEAAPFVLLGLLVAGLLHEFLDTSRIVSALGGRDLRSILTATFLGAPLPLCSCGVLPAALSLRKKGASREATIAFLISTPETGVDSIALTYGLLGPIMALARPLAAIVTGVVAGVLSLFGPQVSEEPAGPLEQNAAPPHSHEPPTRSQQARAPLYRRLLKAVRYGFVTLLDDLAFWLLLAFLVTGVLSAALPADFFQRYLPDGFLSLVVMAALGIPTYVCASASTPVAAAMIAKGLNPGAALVFMLTGPATNASTVGIVARLFGRRFVLTYLGAIFGVALLAGVLVNLAFGPGWTPPVAAAQSSETVWAGLQTVAGLTLAVLMGKSLARTGLRPGLAEVAGHFKALAGWSRTFDWRSLPWKTASRVAVPILLVLWISRAFVVVGPGEEGLRRTFGRVSASRLQPGLHVYWPPPIGRIDVVAKDAARTVELGYLSLPDRTPAAPAAPRSFPRVLPSFGGQRTSRIPEGSDFLAGDETVVAVTGVVQYQVADSAVYQLGVDRPDSVVRAVARSALVAAIARTPIDALYSSARGEVETQVLHHLRATSTAAAIGVRPISFNLLYVHAPEDVHAAFRDVASAAEDKTTIRNKALVEAEGSVRLARGEAARLVAEAEGYRVQQAERARGNAAAFAPLAVEDRRASAITRDRLYLEAMERVLGRLPKLIKPSPRKAPGLELWVTPADAGTVRFPADGFPPGAQLERPQDEEGPLNPRPTPPPRP